MLSLKAVDKRLSEALKLLQRFVDVKREIQAGALSEREKSARIKKIRIADTRIDDMALDFTVPGYSKIELKVIHLNQLANTQPGGKNIDVTIDNVEEYIDLVVDFTIGRGIKRQIDAFKEGFSKVFPYEALCAFTADELVMLFGKSEEDWSYESSRLHGLSNDSSCGLCESRSWF